MNLMCGGCREYNASVPAEQHYSVQNDGMLAHVQYFCSDCALANQKVTDTLLNLHQHAGR